MRRFRILVIGLTLLASGMPAGADVTELGGSGVTDPAADLAADTAGSLLGLPNPDAPEPPPKTHVNKVECRRIAKQIVHFENVKGMAEERDDELWANATQQHIERLEGRWWAKCDTGEDEFAKEFSRALRLAARAAVKYFTWGGF
jgi:hypothetical protein